MPLHKLPHDLPSLRACMDLHGKPALLAPAIPQAGQSRLSALLCKSDDGCEGGPVRQPDPPFVIRVPAGRGHLVICWQREPEQCKEKINEFPAEYYGPALNCPGGTRTSNSAPFPGSPHSRMVMPVIPRISTTRKRPRPVCLPTPRSKIRAF